MPFQREISFFVLPDNAARAPRRGSPESVRNCILQKTAGRRQNEILNSQLSDYVRIVEQTHADMDALAADG